MSWDKWFHMVEDKRRQFSLCRLKEANMFRTNTSPYNPEVNTHKTAICYINKIVYNIINAIVFTNRGLKYVKFITSLSY